MAEQLTNEQISGKILADYDKYKITVDFLTAWKYYLINKLSGHGTIYLGRELQDSSSNVCRPDLVSEKANLAMVCEVKGGMPRNMDYFIKRDMTQLKSFDNISLGWSSQTITNKEISLFTLSKFQKSLMDFLKTSTTDFKTFSFTPSTDQENHEEVRISFENNFLIWFFSIDESGSAPCFNIFKAVGDSVDAELNSKSKENILIPLQDILQNLSDFRFYDAPPPDLYLLEVLWSHLINILFEQQQYVAKNMSGLRVLTLNVSVDDILAKVNGFFITDLDSFRGTKSIRKKMIERFVDLLCKLEMASKDGDKYNIFYKTVPNAKKYFLDELTNYALKKGLPTGEQMEMTEYLSS
jgi:hypothetical protein